MTQEQRLQLQTWLPLMVLAVLVLTVGIYDNAFFSANNFLSVMADTMTLFLMASGVTLVIMMGGIDLSVQAVASMASCILAAYLQRWVFWPFRLPFWVVPLRGSLVAGPRPDFAFLRSLQPWQ